MIYFARIGDGGPIKIGTTINLKARLYAHERTYQETIVLLGIHDGGVDEERVVHVRFNHLRDNKGRCRGNSELFEPAPELFEYIDKHCRQPDLLDYLRDVQDKTWHVQFGMSGRNVAKAKMLAKDRGLSLDDYLLSCLHSIIKRDWRRLSREHNKTKGLPARRPCVAKAESAD